MGMTAKAPPPLASQLTETYSGLACRGSADALGVACRRADLDQVGVPGIFGDAQVIVALLLLRVLACGLPARRCHGRAAPSWCPCQRRGLHAEVSQCRQLVVAADAVAAQHSRYLDARTKRPAMVAVSEGSGDGTGMECAWNRRRECLSGLLDGGIKQRWGGCEAVHWVRDGVSTRRREPSWHWTLVGPASSCPRFLVHRIAPPAHDTGTNGRPLPLGAYPLISW